MIKKMIVDLAKMGFSGVVCSLSARASVLLTDVGAFSFVSVCMELKAWTCCSEPDVKLEINVTAKKVPIIAIVFKFIPRFLFKAHQDADLHVVHLPMDKQIGVICPLGQTGENRRNGAVPAAVLELIC
jgi:hypothetical protein